MRGVVRSGSTLVEIMATIAIFAIIVLGTAGYLSQAQARIVTQSYRLAATVEAAERLEQVRRADLTEIDPPSNNYNVYYLDHLTANWRVDTTDHGETAVVANRPRPMTTTVQFVDANGGASSYDFVRVTVTLQYGRSAAETVSLQTLKAP